MFSHFYHFGISVKVLVRSFNRSGILNLSAYQYFRVATDDKLGPGVALWLHMMGSSVTASTGSLSFSINFDTTRVCVIGDERSFNDYKTFN